MPSLSFFSQSLQGAGPWPVVHSHRAGGGGGGGGGQLAVVCLLRRSALPGAAVGATPLAAVRPRREPYGEGRREPKPAVRVLCPYVKEQTTQLFW